MAEEYKTSWFDKRPGKLNAAEEAWMRHVVLGTLFNASDYDENGDRIPSVTEEP